MAQRRQILQAWMLMAMFFLCGTHLSAQPFYFGADLSYVNEMEDCNVTYREDGESKDVYAIFADHGCNLVRLRLWHTPSWYDNLNEGYRYSDLADVKIAIARAHTAGMDVLLDFHLSDNWADPGKQVVPAAWADVVDDLPVLKDSLYNYISAVLMELHALGHLPEMVQIGNETNRGILLSQEVNDAGWVLDWDRNSQLFNTAIDAVRDVEAATDEDIVIALHAAGPEDATWLYEQFLENGVTDFDVMGISYYWAWHQPTDIEGAGDVIEDLIANHPGYEVMIFETGYIWTTQGNDNAGNIITSTHPDYAPASPEAQRRFLVDLTQEVINSGGTGVIYWEPAWVSSFCWTQWGQGSHQEHATFFDFNNNLIENGGIAWMTYPYENLSAVAGPGDDAFLLQITFDTSAQTLYVLLENYGAKGTVRGVLVNSAGQAIHEWSLEQESAMKFTSTTGLPSLPPGVYIVTLSDDAGKVFSQKVVLGG